MDKRVKWSEEDVAAIKEVYKTYPYQKFPDWLLKKHTQDSCYYKAYRLKLASRLRHPGIDLRHLSASDKGYIAGFMDGEGSIIFYKDREKLNPALQFPNTHKGALEYLQKKLTTGSLAITRRTHKNLNYKDLYQLHIHGAKQVYDILRAIEPYLIIKKEKAKIALQMLKTKYRF